MVKKAPTIAELKAQLSELRLKKLNYIMQRLRKVKAEYNEWEVITYVRGLLDLSWELLKKKTGDDIADQIKREIDHHYSL